MDIEVIAYHLERRFDLSFIRSLFPKLSLVKREHTFLLYERAENSYVYIKDYGSIVFFNCDESYIKTTICSILEKEVHLKNLPSEFYNLSETNTTDVDFGYIEVEVLNIDTVHIVCLNLAQSVALMNYVDKTSDLHDKTLTYSKQLEKTGSFKLSKNKMRRFIGKTMNLKNSIAEDLFVFEAPEVAWNTKELSLLDYKLRDELDVVKRHHGVVNSLNVIKENLDLFRDIMNHKYSSMLEWIIIILILLEVMQMFF
ncbi:RMD1 family protein [Tenacibaculum sp. M341]|uniref:RMD1 family protein n=1 Tax=Tenacibaculum sp. M341 TaxID=2530339 RepID=UPI00105112C9|nr:RMD1 family protein [Tenacibaculum sp. M341]TCI90975.1 RMD1 family protein [Tenacibaculum sp. M341]